MSLRTKEEIEKIEDLRQDPDEAREKMTGHMKQLESQWRQHKRSLMERVDKRAEFTFRSREEIEELEEARQDPDEAHQKMTAHMRELSRSYRQQKGAMTVRVRARSSISTRTLDEKQKHDDGRREESERRGTVNVVTPRDRSRQAALQEKHPPAPPPPPGIR